MNKPKDHSRAVMVGWVRFARIFSNVISPPVIFALMGLALAWKELSFWPGFIWAAVYGFWVSLMPILVVVYLLRTKRISDLHMSHVKERRIPYASSVLGSIIAYLIIQFGGGPPLLFCLSIFSIVSLATLGIITEFWLISIHATSIAAASLVGTLVFGLGALFIMLPWVVLVSWMRLYLRRHTISQVVAGLSLGTLLVLIMTGVGCFV